MKGPEYMKHANAIVLAIIAFSTLGWAGESDYQDAKREQAEYCQNVKDGVWPDFRETYDSECR